MKIGLETQLLLSLLKKVLWNHGVKESVLRGRWVKVVMKDRSR
jgi:hypothetical protein